MDFIKEIDTPREQAGIKVPPLCKRAKIGVNTYYRWRRGEYPQMRKYERLKAALAALINGEAA